MSIQTFYTTAARKDFARLFQFRLRSFGNINFLPEHFTYVETASLPGRSITNVPVPYMGLSFNVPGTVTYPGSPSYAVTFRCDQNYDLRAVLEAATFNTFDEATSTGQYSLPGAGSALTMELLDKQMNPIRYYTLFGVYVQALADTAYNIGDTGTIATINATLAYQYWRSGKISPVNSSTQYSTAVPPWVGRGLR